ncbi:MAG: CBS domain-containing protein [Gammaproteobacteria bacterium]|nr:CBS domain-containing protein [Gammaproteobacteria bacterium]
MFNKSVKVSDHMLKRPVLAKPDDDLYHAIHQILAHKISGVTVVDERNKPVGMLSELDALKAIVSREYYQEDVGVMLVKDYMTPSVESVGVGEDIIDVAMSMLDHKHRRRPVVDSHGTLVGQVTCRQLLKGIKDLDHPEDKRER